MSVWTLLFVVPIEFCHTCVICEAAIYARCADGHHDDLGKGGVRRRIGQDKINAYARVLGTSTQAYSVNGNSYEEKKGRTY
jgi:hypothetical protein